MCCFVSFENHFFFVCVCVCVCVCLFVYLLAFVTTKLSFRRGDANFRIIHDRPLRDAYIRLKLEEGDKLSRVRKDGCGAFLDSKELRTLQGHPKLLGEEKCLGGNVHVIQSVSFANPELERFKVEGMIEATTLSLKVSHFFLRIYSLILANA